MRAKALDVLASSIEGPLVSPRRLAQLANGIRGWLRSQRAAGLPQEVQRARLARTLDYAARRSPFYREALAAQAARVDERTVLAALAEMPFTYPADVREWRRFLCVPEAQLGAVHTTSGTAGTPKVIGFTRRELQRLVTLWALGMRIGHDGPMRVLIALPTTHGLWIGTASATRAVERAGGLPLPVGTPQPSEALAWMRRFEPNMIVSSPSYLSALTRQAQEEGYRARLDGLTLGGEPLDDERKQRFSAYWGSSVQESYGATEIGGPQTIALPDCRALHLNEFHLYTEIVEPGGTTPAEEGDLVFTTLTREAMPLVRYRIGDRARWDACDCGLPLRSIKLLGRSDDMLTLGGAHVEAQVLADAVAGLPGTAGRVALRIEREGGIDHLTLRVEGDDVDEGAVRDALWGAYPRLRDTVDGAQLRLTIETGVDLSRQVKGFSVRDTRPG